MTVYEAARRPVGRVSMPRRPSRFLLRFFDVYLSLYMPLHFRALRLAHPERFPLNCRSLIVVINHASWWDPLTSVLLSRFFLRHKDHYAPIDSASLPRHRILGGLGLFPVEQNTARGAAQFLRAALAICADANAVLWLTPQGGFADVRARPLIFKAGLPSLIKRLQDVTVLPLAFEYTFWNEPKPEILACCGEPIVFRHGDRESDPGATIAARLARTQDELASLALSRDPALFRKVTADTAEGGTLRAMLHNLLAAWRMDPYQAELHEPVPDHAAPGSF